jgi:hypothetical protein
MRIAVVSCLVSAPVRAAAENVLIVCTDQYKRATAIEIDYARGVVTYPGTSMGTLRADVTDSTIRWETPHGPGGYRAVTLNRYSGELSSTAMKNDGSRNTFGAGSVEQCKQSEKKF